MTAQAPVWTRQFSISAPTHNQQRLPGDKILLPPSALEQLLSVYTKPVEQQQSSTYFNRSSYAYGAFNRHDSQFQDLQQQQLPQPLTFRLVNPSNGRAVYAGVREFSAEEEQVTLSHFLVETLGLDTSATQDAANPPQITIHAKQLPKGTFVKLRPLEAGYDPADWKALLEQHLRSNFTTLTNGEVLSIVTGRSATGRSQTFKFLVDGFQPESDGICVVDTDLEVDIEALNEDQARETLRKIAEKTRKDAGDDRQGSSSGGILSLFAAQSGQVLPGEYVDYELSSWDRTQPLELELIADDDEDESLDILASPLSSTQRSRPREDENVLAALDSRPAKRIRLDPTNAASSGAEALYVTVHAFANLGEEKDDGTTSSRRYTIRARHGTSDATGQDGSSLEARGESHDGEVQCKNCNQWVPKQTLVLHENFCLRNNILCPKGCGQVFQKRSPLYQEHWHCPHDSEFGNTPLGLRKHNHLYHPEQVLRCQDCGTQETFSSIPALAQHRTTTCPAKLILCRFCHLEVPQEGDPDIPSAEVLLSGMTQHELLDGARTTECHMCGRIVRLRDMDTHLKSHDLDRHSRLPPRPCRNVNCGRTLDTAAKNGDTRAGARMAQGAGNEIGLCNICFGPLYVSLHDPEGKALRRRVERRYLQQLVTAGCGKPWCRNEFCKTGRSHLEMTSPASMKEGLPLIKTFVQHSTDPVSGSPLHFCVDEASQRRRTLADMLAAEDGGPAARGGYTLEWCIGALEAENGDLDAARQWLKNWAPTRHEK